MESLFNGLLELINESDNVIIISHSDPDLDALGSSLGLCSILKSMDKEAYVFLNIEDKDINSNVKQAVSLVPNYNYINKKNYKEYIKDNSLLIIVDTHKQERLYYPDIISEVSKVVVLDHHIKMNDYIKNTEIFYIDSSLSSVVELIAFFSKFTHFSISPVVASIMLTGMVIDTNNFNIKATERAFEAAAYLVSQGADPIVKQNLLKETKDEFLRKADFIKSSYIYNKNMAICLLNATESTPAELAEISESLLKFEYVEASFTIGQLGKKVVGISARSMGDIDVCSIMKKLGGGGHATNAAVQVENTTIKALEKALKKAIGE